LEENLKRQLEQNEKEIDSMKQGYEQKLAEALAKAKENDRSKANEKAKICPHLSNINVDPMLTGSVKHIIEFNGPDKRIVIGSGEKSSIQMFGLGVNEAHACLSTQNGDFFLEPYANSRVLKNGKLCEEKFKLNNFDRLVFGATLYYLFIDPSKFDKDTDEIVTKANNFTVEKVQQEIAEQSGLITNNFDYKKPEEIACLNELIDLMPAIEEANEMSIFLDRKMKYEPIILNPIVIGDPHSKAKV
jgi:kinesin family protein 1